MSYWVRLNDPKTGETLEMDYLTEDGGTYVLGGTNECELNVTYNYSKLFNVKIRLDEQIAENTIDSLHWAVEVLGTERYQDYWAPTVGNVGHMCSVLLAWAIAHPTGVWEVN